MIPLWAQAALWGLLAGSALLLGAAAGFLFNIPQRAIAAVMAFGSGVLISALTFELMEDAWRHGGLLAAGAGFIIGATLFSGVNWMLARRGARHRKRSGDLQPREQSHSGSGVAIAVGALLDGIPESIVIGVSVLAGGGRVGLVTVIAVFLSNIPEGLSSAAGMKQAGRSATYVFTLWGVVAATSAVAAWIGYVAFGGSPAITAVVTAIAAGAILTMLIDTMIPEAFASAHDFAGLLTVVGFLLAFMLSKSSV